MTLAFFRPEACPSRPCVPPRSTKLVSNRSSFCRVFVLSQSLQTGRPRPGRDLADLLSEGLALAQRLLAGVQDLVPADRQALLAVGHVPRGSRAALTDRGRDDATHRAERRRRIRRHHMDQARGSAWPMPCNDRVGGDMFDVSDPHSGQAEQDGPTVGTHSWLLVFSARNHRKHRGATGLNPGPESSQDRVVPPQVRRAFKGVSGT
jgi:hypothetical protein